jgi:hypothetical protein
VYNIIYNLRLPHPALSCDPATPRQWADCRLHIFPYCPPDFVGTSRLRPHLPNHSLLLRLRPDKVHRDYGGQVRPLAGRGFDPARAETSFAEANGLKSDILLTALFIHLARMLRARSVQVLRRSSPPLQAGLSTDSSIGLARPLPTFHPVA